MARCPNCGAAVDPADDECDLCNAPVEGFVAVPDHGESVVEADEVIADRQPLITVTLYLLGFAIAVSSTWFIFRRVEEGLTVGIGGLLVSLLVVAGGTAYALRNR